MLFRRNNNKEQFYFQQNTKSCINTFITIIILAVYKYYKHQITYCYMINLLQNQQSSNIGVPMLVVSDYKNNKVVKNYTCLANINNVIPKPLLKIQQIALGCIWVFCWMFFSYFLNIEIKHWCYAHIHTEGATPKYINRFY